MRHIAINLMLLSGIIAFALVMLIDRPYKETYGALVLDVLTVLLGYALLIDWAFCAILVFAMTL